jgi:hypothetical protein
MKELRIHHDNLIEITKWSTELWLRHLLRSKKFDLSKPIVQFEDYEKRQTVFQQEDDN